MVVKMQPATCNFMKKDYFIKMKMSPIVLLVLVGPFQGEGTKLAFIAFSKSGSKALRGNLENQGKIWKFSKIRENMEN